MLVRNFDSTSSRNKCAWNTPTENLIWIIKHSLWFQVFWDRLVKEKVLKQNICFINAKSCSSFSFKFDKLIHAESEGHWIFPSKTVHIFLHFPRLKNHVGNCHFFQLKSNFLQSQIYPCSERQKECHKRSTLTRNKNLSFNHPSTANSSVL